MFIKVRSYATLKRYTDRLSPEWVMELQEGSTVQDVMNALEVPLGLKKLILVNGRNQHVDHVLKHEDEVVFFPPLEGG